MPAEKFKLIETRQVSRRGVLRIPKDKKYRHFYVDVEVIRLPLFDARSSKFNPDRSEYAKLVFLRDGYVQYFYAVNFEKQTFQIPIDETGYLATYLGCAITGIVKYLSYLAPFISAPPLISDPNNPIYVEPLSLRPDEIKIVGTSNSGLSLKLFGLKYDVQCPEGEPNSKEPPPKDKTPPIPPTSPIPVSPPYDPPNDDGDTDPVPGDLEDPTIRCRDVGYWKIEYTTVSSGGLLEFQVRGKEDDVFTLVPALSPGCLDSTQEDFYCNDTLISAQFSCQVRVQNFTVFYLGLQAPSPSFEDIPNSVYAGC